MSCKTELPSFAQFFILIAIITTFVIILPEYLEYPPSIWTSKKSNMKFHSYHIACIAMIMMTVIAAPADTKRQESVTSGFRVIKKATIFLRDDCGNIPCCNGQLTCGIGGFFDFCCPLDTRCVFNNGFHEPPDCVPKSNN